MTDDKPIQLDFVDQAKNQTLKWAKDNGIALHIIETVIPLITTDKGLDVWLFFDTDNRAEQYQQDGTTKKVKQEYLRTLKILDYPSDYLAKVKFHIDSHENVIKNYEGSYFYRLR